MSRQIKISPAGLAGEDVQHDRPPCRVSFIVPAFQAMRTLRASIESVRASAPPGSEVIIVDDGSFDDTPKLAAELGDLVLNRPCQGGAARSRNDGARVARGEILFFVDSDVTINPAAVAGALRHFDAGAHAVFGAYEALPPPAVRNAATNYKNILHHYTHLQGAGEAQTFWSGFGAVRRDAFMAVRGFDPAVTTGADVEDIHLGYRLRAAGFRIMLDPTLQVQHHKHYTVRGMIASDIYHRAIPWTRTMLTLRTFSNDLNLRRHSMLSAAVSVALPLTVAVVPWVGPAALLATPVMGGTWLWLNRGFLGYVARNWSLRGAASSAGFLYLYFLYGILGTFMGTAAFLLRHQRQSTLNWLRLDALDAEPPEVAVTLAVVVGPGEPLSAFAALPDAAPWWELIVVSSDRPAGLPAHARLIAAPAGSSRNQMRQLALEAARGEMFATLDAHCRPDPGWLERVRGAADGSVLMIAGPFHHDRRSLVCRADQVARYWQWRPERPPAWVVDHPATNAAFRAAVARWLGGFREEGALVLRMAAFGARPVRFDPAMGVQITARPKYRIAVRGVAGVYRLRAAASARYFDIGVLHRLFLVATSPIAGAASLGRVFKQAVREGSADRTFLLGLPLIAVEMAGAWAGRAIGLLRPSRRGGLVPRTADDLAGLASEPPPLASAR